MKLIIHNILTSNLMQGVTKGFPLKIRASKIDRVAVEYNRTFLLRLLPRIEYGVLRQAASDVSYLHYSLRSRFALLARFERNTTDHGSIRWRLSEDHSSSFAWIWRQGGRAHLSGNRPSISYSKKYSKHVVASKHSSVNKNVSRHGNRIFDREMKIKGHL